jgi:predicted component of type VI protein secretion system
MPAQLVALTDGPSILLDKPILLLGRHPECDIQIDSRKVSRRHCCIAQVGDHLVVRDLGSTNGIRINGARVAEGRLRPGDELTIGSHRYRVAWDEVAARAPAARSGAVEPQPGPPATADPEDEALEACEEPVPLPEPSSPLPRDDRTGKVPPPPARPREESYILPENLELLPGSGPRPEMSPPSGVHPPG